MTYNISNTQATIVIEGEVFNIQSDDFRFDQVINLLGDNDKEGLLSILKVNSRAEIIAHEDGEFIFNEDDNTISYNGVLIEGTLGDTLKALTQRNFKDLDRFKNFVNRLLKNPSSSSIKELYDFMSYKQLPISEDGYLIAYKGVRHNFYSSHGNIRTIVKQGSVDGSGRILNNLGDVIEVDRNQVDDNRDIGCSFGLHVGSMDYASSFGAKTLLVKVDPADVVSVPTDCNYQKMRVCKYEVVSEIENEIKVVAVDMSEGAVPVDQQTLKANVSDEATIIEYLSFQEEGDYSDLTEVLEYVQLVTENFDLNPLGLYSTLVQMQGVEFQSTHLGNLDLIGVRLEVDDVFDEGEDEGSDWDV